MKHFNVTGLCVKEKHYMADISAKINEIMELVAKGKYFTINRARQYGKTTTLAVLAKSLPDDYTCISISFEGVGETMFKNPASFCQRFLLRISKTLENTDKEFAASWLDESVTDFDLFEYHLDRLCKNRKIVLMIDEVDRTSENRVFLHFLGMLRNMYLARENGTANTFQSVILAGVYDIKNIKLKLINEGVYAEKDRYSQDSINQGNIYNSPWNIAADFNVDMSFSPSEIATMLSEYEVDNHTGLDIDFISGEIYEYTSGYPFLVSRICQCIDEKLDKDWTKTGIQHAVKIILEEKSVLFDDMVKNLENNKDLYNFLYSLLIVGERKAFVTDNPIVEWCSMFGYIKRSNGFADGQLSRDAIIANKIFEMRMSYYFCSKDETV